MVSPNKANVDLREMSPLPRNTLHSCGVKDHSNTGQRASQLAVLIPTGYRGWLLHFTNPKVSAGYLNYPADARDSAKSGTGHKGNRHLRYLVEFISVNVGGLRQNAKVSSPPMSGASVGAVIVVRGWESQPHGEGPQFVGTSDAEGNRMQTRGRKLL